VLSLGITVTYFERASGSGSEPFVFDLRRRTAVLRSQLNSIERRVILTQAGNSFPAAFRQKKEGKNEPAQPSIP
jgi:hypothetical protein